MLEMARFLDLKNLQMVQEKSSQKEKNKVSSRLKIFSVVLVVLLLLFSSDS